MLLEQTACEDLKAFERRLTEVINRLQPSTVRWRMTTLNRTCISVVLTVAVLSTTFGAYLWLSDPITHSAIVPRALINRLFFIVAAFSLVLLFIVGIHKKVVFPSIITSRTRIVLSDFNMSCDDTGKLILKPRPTTT